jgi:hypothetical protein
LQRDDCLGENKVIANFSKTDQVDPVLANAVNSLELITSRELSKCSGQLDDAVLSWRSCAGLVGRAEASGLCQVEVGVGLLQCGHERGRDGRAVLYRESVVEAHALRLRHLKIIGERNLAGPLLIRMLLAILKPVSKLTCINNNEIMYHVIHTIKQG